MTKLCSQLQTQKLLVLTVCIGTAVLSTWLAACRCTVKCAFIFSFHNLTLCATSIHLNDVSCVSSNLLFFFYSFLMISSISILVCVVVDVVTCTSHLVTQATHFALALPQWAITVRAGLADLCLLPMTCNIIDLLRASVYLANVASSTWHSITFYFNNHRSEGHHRMRKTGYCHWCMKRKWQTSSGLQYSISIVSLGYVILQARKNIC